MKICIVSDTHNSHEGIKELPDADIIIHCGDITHYGSDKEIGSFMNWFSSLNQYKYKIVIAGNHDRLFELAEEYSRSLIPSNVIYLENTSVEVMGVKMYGTPANGKYGNWAFNYSETSMFKFWERIPIGLDVLITHTPPHEILDNINFLPDSRHIGSVTLRYEIINRIKPKYNVFGHAHAGYGVKKIDETTYINASSTNEWNIICNKPVIIEL